MISRVIVCVLLALLLNSCALPRSADGGNFVPQSDLLAVSLARDAASYFQQSRFIDAELSYRQALRVAPQAYNIQRNLARTLVKLGSFDEAERIYSKLALSKSDDQTLKLALAALYYEKGDFRKAEELYKALLELQIRSGEWGQAAETQRNLAAMYFRVGRELDALCLSEQALNLSPTMDQTMRHLRLLLALGRFATAAGVLNRIALDAPERLTPEFATLSALASYGSGDVPTAFARADQFVRLQGKDAGLQTDLRLVQFFSDPRKLEERSQAERDEYAGVLRGDVLSQPLMLYLPPKLVQQVYQASQQLESE